ncbi:hypothetical protein BD410DRAFT_643228 [Rickenella mellea]|uniref:Uncharacterized protein n=1 Tax=Rickenella mellea TaxID=50990 RepID=A0A4Y7PL88_9AGAM|nr:hypothetical protein BD410DRAFT_643228 [Rickenella mellea]
MLPYIDAFAGPRSRPFVWPSSNWQLLKRQKLFSLLFVTLASALSAFAQIEIASPTPGQTLHPGQSFIVRLDKPNRITPSTEVGIAIGLSNGQPSTDFSNTMYSILYTGPFSPQRDDFGFTPFQDYLVTVPSLFSQGESVLNVWRAALIGNTPDIITEVLNVTVTLV